MKSYVHSESTQICEMPSGTRYRSNGAIVLVREPVWVEGRGWMMLCEYVDDISVASDHPPVHKRLSLLIKNSDILT